MIQGKPEKQIWLKASLCRWKDTPSEAIVNSLAAATAGYAGADLQALCASAVLAAVSRALPSILDTDAECGQTWSSADPQLLPAEATAAGPTPTAEGNDSSLAKDSAVISAANDARKESRKATSAQNPSLALNTLKVALLRAWLTNGCRGRTRGRLLLEVLTLIDAGKPTRKLWGQDLLSLASFTSYLALRLCLCPTGIDTESGQSFARGMWPIFLSVTTHVTGHELWLAKGAEEGSKALQSAARICSPCFKPSTATAVQPIPHPASSLAASSAGRSCSCTATLQPCSSSEPKLFWELFADGRWAYQAWSHWRAPWYGQ